MGEGNVEALSMIFTDPYIGIAELMQSSGHLPFYMFPVVEPIAGAQYWDGNQQLEQETWGSWELTLYPRSVKIEGEIRYFSKWIGAKKI